MTRTQRVVTATGALVVAVLTVVGLTRGGTPSQGPIGRLLEAIGGAVSDAEVRMARSLRGPGRRAALEWVAPYAESPAALRTPKEVLLGAYDSGIPVTLDGILAVEHALGVPLPLIHLYTAWGDRPDQQFPRRLVVAISELGSIPVVTWEPWLSVFDERLHPELRAPAERDRDGLADVARGAYDFYLDRWAAEAADFGRPLIVRFAHEMNDAYRYSWGPHHNRPEDYIAAWRHVVDRFRRAGADNVLWAWSPHVAFDGWEVYYPGDEVVDWVATGALNYASVAYWSKWWSFGEIFSSKYLLLARYGKPVMIAELGTLAVGGDPASWYRDALTDLPQRHPLLKAVMFFHSSADQTVTQQTLDWSFADRPAIAAAVAEAVRGWAPGSHRPPGT